VHSEPRKFSPTYVIGTVLVCIGVLANEWVLKRLLSSDGSLEFETRVQIWFFEAVSVLLGLLLIWYSRWPHTASALRRSIRNHPATAASIFGFVLAVALWLSTEGLFYFLNHLKTGEGVRFENRIEGVAIAGDAGEGFRGYQKDALLGYKPLPNMRMISKMTFNGRQIYNVTYSTDERSRRLTPVQSAERPGKFILFFGCSFTFGEGVQDDETLPFFVGQHAPGYKPYNYGVNGYGPQQMVAKLQQGNIKAEINEPEGILVYTFIDDHIHRVIGSQHVVQSWGRYMPYYALDSNGNLERKGSFASAKPGLAFLYWLLGKSEIAQYFQIGIGPRIDDDDFSLTARMFLESRDAFSRLFNAEKFLVLIYPGSTSGKRLISHLEKNQVQYFDYSNLFDPTQTDLHIERDPHPTPRAHRMVAERLTRDLGILDVRKQGTDSALTEPFANKLVHR
jgi:hypothetical protein